jgi:DNA-binding transcriptional ArsR family regulator
MQANSDRLSAVFGALADPTRRAILARLTLGEASVAELAEPFDMSVSAVSKHVAVLERAGLLSRSQDAQRRPSALVVAPLQEAEMWLGYYLRLWESRFTNIDKVLKNVMEERAKNARK